MNISFRAVTVGQLAAMDFSVWSTSRSTCRWGDLFVWLLSARYTRLARTIDTGRQAELARDTQSYSTPGPVSTDTSENWWREDVSSDGVCEQCVVYGTVTILSVEYIVVNSV